MPVCLPGDALAARADPRSRHLVSTGDHVFLRKDIPKVEAEAVIEAMENPNDRAILAVTQTEARPAQEIIESTGIPKSTAYRRIQHLQEVGLLVVESGTMVSGHPIERYRARLQVAVLRLEDGQVEAEWRLRETPDERLHRLWSELAGGGKA